MHIFEEMQRLTVGMNLEQVTSAGPMRYSFYSLATVSPNTINLREANLPFELGRYPSLTAPQVFHALVWTGLHGRYVQAAFAGPLQNSDAGSFGIVRAMYRLDFTKQTPTIENLEVLIPDSNVMGFETYQTLDGVTTVRNSRFESRVIDELPSWYKNILVAFLPMDELIQRYSEIHPYLEQWLYEVIEAKIPGLLPKGMRRDRILPIITSLRQYIYQYAESRVAGKELVRKAKVLESIGAKIEPQILRYKDEIGPLSGLPEKRNPTRDGASDAPLVIAAAPQVSTDIPTQEERWAASEARLKKAFWESAGFW